MRAKEVPVRQLRVGGEAETTALPSLEEEVAFLVRHHNVVPGEIFPFAARAHIVGEPCVGVAPLTRASYKHTENTISRERERGDDDGGRLYQHKWSCPGGR